MVNEPEKKGVIGKLVEIAAPAQSLITLVALVGLILTGFNYVKTSIPDAAGTNQLRVDITNNLKAQTDSLLQLQEDFQNFANTMTINSKNASEQREELQTSVNGIVTRVEKLEKAVNTDTNPSPALHFFNTGNKIEPLVEGDLIRIGDFVRLTYSYSKLRDCGKSEPDDLVVDINRVIAHFEKVSVLDDKGKGLSTPVDPSVRNEITYVARIPLNAGLSPGPALAYVSIVYDHDKCPAVDVIESPRIPFVLSPPVDKKIKLMDN